MGFSTFGSQEIASSLVSLEIIFEDLSLICPVKILKIPEINLIMQTLAVQIFLELDGNQGFVGISTKRTTPSGI